MEVLLYIACSIQSSTTTSVNSLHNNKWKAAEISSSLVQQLVVVGEAKDSLCDGWRFAGLVKNIFYSSNKMSILSNVPNEYQLSEINFCNQENKVKLSKIHCAH